MADKFTLVEYCSFMLEDALKDNSFTLVDSFIAKRLKQSLMVDLVTETETGRKGCLAYLILDMEQKTTIDLKSLTLDEPSALKEDASGFILSGEMYVSTTFIPSEDLNTVTEQLKLLSDGTIYYNILVENGTVFDATPERINELKKIMDMPSSFERLAQEQAYIKKYNLSEDAFNILKYDVTHACN